MITYTTNEFGLRQKDMDYMLQLFSKMRHIERVTLFGSRAKGDFQKGADIDLAIAGAKVTSGEISHLHDMLEHESPTLLWFDVVHYDTLKSDMLKQQIDAFGKVIYIAG